MCGISGVSGHDALRLTVMLTLGQLERGVEGTGVAYLDHSRIRIIKEPTNPIQFLGRHFNRLDPKANVAIGHNRMPSRGQVTYVNTHPFVACRGQFALVHNGSVPIRKSTERKIRRTHTILGKTDSEIITHLLEDLYLKNDDMVAALTELCDTEFSGAILVLHKDGSIYGLRKGLEPIHYCVTDQNVLLASSMNAVKYVAGERAKVERLKSGQIIEVRGLQVRIHDTDHVSDLEGLDLMGLSCDIQYPYSWRAYFRRASSPYFTF
jgi:glucosamine 6-phosphate synthetase-like amidotransferase/phosphosugar isomerase protein